MDENCAFFSFLVKCRKDDFEKGGEKGEPTYKVNLQTDLHYEWSNMETEDLEIDFRELVMLSWPWDGLRVCPVEPRSLNGPDLNLRPHLSHPPSQFSL